ncbi:glycosyltransferase [Pseudomonas abietaniphila]|uniref:Glycosyltransferase involved in cell wall bisynthesis n=1 Tax=Pseudomonas abietaniphila TaxID=89065 RepID=A0A1G8BT23_9PSED|nr:glycosyltransferase [Pseudomonas abietaniphila]SDH36249.1 Glycosyltransferase involved in cell wall bisynthesis [Pseudomonas abietaniphila]
MIKRPVIGIPFNYDESWIGGTYYIKNLVSSLKLVDESVRPEVWIISHSEKSFDFIRRSTGYLNLHWTKPELIKGIDGGISRRIKYLSWLTPWFRKQEFQFDMIFPYPIDKTMQQTVCWIPDFQDKRLPGFFDASELAAREQQHREYFTSYKHVLFSSDAARHDFEEFYPEADVQKHVVQFATFEQSDGKADHLEVLKKYDLDRRFFYCPNQFWVHKNHEVVIDAVQLLKKRGVEVVVAFSGKEHDHRAPDHTKKLKDKVAQLGLSQNVVFLGFIPREDQMVIFKEAVSIVQPSLFEGWSTVIEDAKSVSQYVIASAIPANMEQAKENIEFFNPNAAFDLAAIMEKYASIDPERKIIDYGQCQREFALSFMRVVTSLMRSVNAGARRASDSVRQKN